MGNYRISNIQISFNFDANEEAFLREVSLLSGFSMDVIIEFVFARSVNLIYKNKYFFIEDDSPILLKIHEIVLKKVEKYSSLNAIIDRFDCSTNHDLLVFRKKSSVLSEVLSIDLRLKLFPRRFDPIYRTIEYFDHYFGIKPGEFLKILLLDFLSQNDLLKKGVLIDDFEQATLIKKIWKPYGWSDNPFSYLEVKNRYFPIPLMSEYAFIQSNAGKYDRIIWEMTESPQGARHWATEYDKLKSHLNSKYETLFNKEVELLKQKRLKASIKNALPISDRQILSVEELEEAKNRATENVEIKQIKLKLKALAMENKLDELLVSVRTDHLLQQALPAITFALNRSVTDVFKMLYICFLRKHEVISDTGVLREETYKDRIKHIVLPSFK